MAVVLVVEDEPNIAEIIAEIVEQLNHDVRLAATAAEAVAITRAERPDAILLDIILPDGRGTTVLDQLHALRPDVPIIMVTANADEELARETLKRGAMDYVMKPFNIPQLAQILEAALAS
jgi:DNA-binding response OmpR family regulator